MDRHLRKQQAKQIVRRVIGEPYVGKRLKIHRLRAVLHDLRLSPSAILDAGTEDGTFAYLLGDLYPQAQVTGIDLDSAAIRACAAARPSAYSGRVEFKVGTFASTESESFDLITA